MLKSPRLALAAAWLSVAAPSGASAFWVDDHHALTQAALERALEAGASPSLAAHRDAVLHGATAEDLNLHVKWTGWHHFYRPEGALDSALRAGSDARVEMLWEEALDAARGGDLSRAWDRAGHLAHHIQDVASPPHVVPVNHSFADGFERWGLRDVLKRLPSRQVDPLPGPEAQHALARETLEAVRSQFLRAEDGVELPWSTFWSEPDARRPGSFGVYGSVGNAFGQAEPRWKDGAHRVSPETYDAFMADRAAAAVAYSQAFLTWAAQRFEEVAAPDAPPFTARGFIPSPELSLQGLGGLARDSRGTTPVAGLRAGLPLPHALRLSVEWTRGLGLGNSPLPAGGWSLAVLSPPLWAWRPSYAVGVDVRASLGVGLFSQEGGTRFGVPVGLRASALLGGPFVASTELRYQGVRPFTQEWTHGFAWTLGLGVALGDR